MKKLLAILLLQAFATGKASSQSFSIHDLIDLTTVPSKNIGYFMSKNGFILKSGDGGMDTAATVFVQKARGKRAYSGPQRIVDIYQHEDLKYFILQTSALSDYLDGEKSLIRSHFIYDNNKDTSRAPAMLFQKSNMTIEAAGKMEDSVMRYTFTLRLRKIPDSIVYAEDLLQFDSHEFLVSYFGERNVKKDMYYLTENELKKCSVLFSGTRHQAVFVWDDEINLNKLSYILVSNILPTQGSRKNTPLDGDNDWKFQTGIRSGMPIRDLLRLNQMDFDVYGNKSDLALMVKPDDKGKINFKKTAVMFSCSDCYDTKILDQPEVSALDIAKANLSMHVLDIVLYP